MRGKQTISTGLRRLEGPGGFLEQPGGLHIRPTAEVRNFGRLEITATRHDEAASANMGVSVFLEKDVALGKVQFDHLRAGGIAAINEKAAKSSTAAATFLQASGSTPVREYRATPSSRASRNASVVRSRRAYPTTANGSGRSRSTTRL